MHLGDVILSAILHIQRYNNDG